MHQLATQLELARAKGKQHLIKFRTNLYHHHMKKPSNDKALLLMRIEKELSVWKSA